MKRHLAYLSYVLRHKWFVFVAGLTTGAPLWRLIRHDWSKFLPSEWGPYSRSFYEEDGSSRYLPDKGFDAAWLKHIHRNDHHWQHWVLEQDNGRKKLLPMPDPCILEMVADWAGAGRAITGRWDVSEWYQKNREKIQLEEVTRAKVEHLVLSVLPREGWFVQ